MGLTEKTDEELANEKELMGVTLVTFWKNAWALILANDIKGEVQYLIGRGDQDRLRAYLAEFDIIDGVDFPEMGELSTVEELGQARGPG